MSPLIAPLQYTGIVSWPLRFTLSKMKEEESRELGKMLLDIIQSALTSPKMNLGTPHLELFPKIYHDAMNRLEAQWFWLSLLGWKPTETSVWKEGMSIATWLNSVGTVPTEQTGE